MDEQPSEISADEQWEIDAVRSVTHRKSGVLDLLEENGGRLWQRELVEEIDRQPSTVSRWLCALEEEDSVERIQIGREKVVYLPESDVGFGGEFPEMEP